MSFHAPQRDRKKVSKKHQEREQRRQLGKVLSAARQAELARRGPLFIARPPRTDAERAELRKTCLQKASLEGFKGRRRRERADAIYLEVVAEAQNLVRVVKPGQTIIVPPERKDSAPRGPGGIIVLPRGPGLVKPP